MSLKIRIPKSIFKELERGNKNLHGHLNYAHEVDEKTIMSMSTDFGIVELISTPDEEFTEDRTELVTRFKDITI